MLRQKALRISQVGLRGVVGAGLTASHVLDFASAFGTFLDRGRPVLIGRDPRRSGVMLREGVISGLLRYPAEIRSHMEELSHLAIADPQMGRMMEFLLSAAMQQETLDTDALLTILGQGELYNMAKGMLRADAFTLTPDRMATDPDRLSRDLEEAIRVMAQGPELETALVEATKRFESDFSEANFAEQQRIRMLKADHDRRVAELAQSEDIV